MNTQPQVSVLMTVYNRAAYLADAVDSVLNSSFQDWELIIVDDQSQDRSVEIARAYALRDSRIRVFVNERNLGDYPNRNRAAAYAVGRYLKYVDSDDVLYPHSLEVMVKALLAHPEAALGLSWSVIDPPRPFPFVSPPVEVLRAHYLGRSVLGVGPSAAILRRDAFEALGGFSGRQFIGDTELWLKLAERWPVISLPPALVWWRQHAGQQMSIEQTRPEVLTIRYQFESALLESTDLLNHAEKNYARARLRHRHGRLLFSMAIRERHMITACALWRASGLNWLDFLRTCRSFRGR